MTVTPLRVTLGGSTIAAAAGIDPWTSRVELFYRFTRPELFDDDAGEAAWWGNRVQPIIFEALRERGYNAFETPEQELRIDGAPWFVGHPDGGAFPESDRPAIVESKLTGKWRYRTDEPLPIEWQAQVQTYMHAAECERAIVAVNHGGTALDVRDVFYDARAVERLLELAGGFVAMVQAGTVPEPVGSDAKLAAHIFPEHTQERVYRLLGDEYETHKRAREWAEAAKRCEEKRDECYARLKLAAGDAETIIGPSDQPLYTWKTQTSNRTDVKRLQAEHPEIASHYVTQSQSRVWRVK